MYISSQTPYGYRIDPLDKNHLVPDEEVAHVVKEIFRLALAGKSLLQISRILTKQQILTPGADKLTKDDTRFERYMKNKDSFFGWCVPISNEKQIVVTDTHEQTENSEIFERDYSNNYGFICLIMRRNKHDESFRISDVYNFRWTYKDRCHI